MTGLFRISDSEEVEYDESGLVKLPRDRFFNPWRIADAENVRAIVTEAVGLVTNYEKYYQLRKRKRRDADQKVFEAIVEAVLCDMIVAYLNGDKRGSAISFSKQILGLKSKYRPKAFSEVLPSVVQSMASPEMDYISLQKGNPQNFGNRGQRSLIWPGDRLIRRIAEHEITLDDIGLQSSEETIILKAAKDGYWATDAYEEYVETLETVRLRSQLAEINDWLAKADISLDYRYVLPGAYPLHDRRLRRGFTRGSFQTGGRLFGGFWQPMNKQDRLRLIRINGEPVVGLDYGQMAARILYGLSKAHPVQDDLYDIEGVEPCYRDGLKTLFNSMLFAEKPLTRKPRGTKDVLPRRSSIQNLCDLIIDAHQPVADHFYTGVGHTTQFIESNVLITVIGDLMQKGVVCLPVHDAVIIPHSAEEMTREIMLEAAEQVAGIRIPVSRDRVDADLIPFSLSPVG